MPAAKPAFPRLRRGQPLAQGLVACWAMYEGAGLRLNDLSGQDNTGALTNGPTWSGGQAGWTLNFDGSNDYVDCGNHKSLDITGPLTIAAWVNVNTAATTSHFLRILGKLTDTPYNGYELNVSDTSQTSGAVYLQVGNAGTLKNVFDTVALPVNAWTHVAGVYDGSTGYLYRDGVLRNTAAFGASAIASSSANLNIGRWPSVPSLTYFPGAIDSVALWNRPLSAAEIEALFADNWRHLRPRPWHYASNPTAVNQQVTLSGRFAYDQQIRHSLTLSPGQDTDKQVANALTLTSNLKTDNPLFQKLTLTSTFANAEPQTNVDEQLRLASRFRGDTGSIASGRYRR